MSCRHPLRPAAAGPRVVVMGADCNFAASLLGGLLSLGIRPVAIGRKAGAASPVHSPGFPAVVTNGAPGPLGRLAQCAAIPSQPIEPSDGAALGQWLSNLAPHFIVLACYPQRLPPELAAIARWGCVNVHPSLLPRYRGPEPLLAQLRAGERETGVTVHLVTPELDAGPVLLQQPVPLRDGVDVAGAERALAVRGSALLAAVVRLWPTGRIRARPQDPRAATAAPWSGREAMEIPRQWSARRAFNFLLAIPALRLPRCVRIAGHDLEVERVVGFEPLRRLGAPVRIRGEEIEIQLRPGVLRLRGRAPTPAPAVGARAPGFRVSSRHRGRVPAG